jgi:antitoxin PrlF
MITATITAKGQITIPAEIRQALKLDTGDQIAFEEVAPGFYAFKPAQKVAVSVLKGIFGKSARVVSIDEMNSVIAKRAAAAVSSGTKKQSARSKK